MLRTLLIAATAFAIVGAAAQAQEQRLAQPGQPDSREEAPVTMRDRFVVSGDECGASRYQHLLGREYARVYEAALLPADAIVQNRHLMRTLEYTPHQLNVVVGGGGRIIAIGCF